MSKSVQGISDTLITQESQEKDKTNNSSSERMTLLVSIFIIVLLALIILVIILSYTLNKDKVPPVSIKLTLLDDRKTTMKIGTSRVLQVLFFSGSDDRTSDDFKSVTQKQVHWRVDPEGVITVDAYGRVEALSTGIATIIVTSIYDNTIRDTKTIEVVDQHKAVSNATRIINYAGPPFKIPSNPQKIIQRYSKQQVEVSDIVPSSIKQVSAHPDTHNKKSKIDSQGVQWEIVSYADNTNRSYLKRTQHGAATDRDREQYFIGNRYLPGNGEKIISIETDGNGGVWTVQQNGTATNIKMIPMSNNQKAELMVEDTEAYVMRHGFASDAQWNGSAWKPSVSDNDGLWTGMFCAGQFMKYASMKRYNASQDEVKLSRNRAVKSLKAVLMNAHVSGRNGTVDAKIRHFNSSKNQVYLSPSYLKKGKSYKIDSYPGSPAEGVGYFGQGAGTTQDGVLYSGKQRYTFKPFNPDDWTLDEEPATTKRTLNHYLARSFVIPALQGNMSWGGLFFKRNQNGTQTVLSGANNLYDFKSTDHPVLNLGNLDLPDVLKTIEEVDGRPLKSSDLVYKGDTSSDTLIGHLFLYKIAFDILDETDQQERQLKELVAETLVGFSQMFINNGYSHVDATGQGTKWMRMTRDFFNSDYTLEDSPLKALQTLLVFKLTYYVTGDAQWKDQYELLINHKSFRYADLTSKLWDRWVWEAFNEDVSPSDRRYRLNFTREQIDEVELVRHVMYNDHYSDDEEAMLAYYLIFQLEEDPSLLAKYKTGLKGYWQTIRRSENALWYLIYQLTEPNNPQSKDYFGNNLVQTAAWALSRHPIDTVTYTAYVVGSRPDVIFEGQLSVNPQKAIATRKSCQDAVYVNASKNYQIYATFDPMKIYQIYPLPQDERSLHKYNGPTFTNIDRGNPNNREAATIFTLPYWLGVYHKMIVFDK